MRVAITIVCAGCFAAFVAERLTGDGFLAVGGAEASRIAGGGCNALSAIFVTSDCVQSPNCTSQQILCSLGSCMTCPNAQNPTIIDGLHIITMQQATCPKGTLNSCTGTAPNCSCTGMLQGNQNCNTFQQNIDNNQSCLGG